MTNLPSRRSQLIRQPGEPTQLQVYEDAWNPCDNVLKISYGLLKRSCQIMRMSLGSGFRLKVEKDTPLPPEIQQRYPLFIISEKRCIFPKHHSYHLCDILEGVFKSRSFSKIEGNSMHCELC